MQQVKLPAYFQKPSQCACAFFYCDTHVRHRRRGRSGLCSRHGHAACECTRSDADGGGRACHRGTSCWNQVMESRPNQRPRGQRSSLEARSHADHQSALVPSPPWRDVGSALASDSDHPSKQSRVASVWGRG